jgi:hypothetical protein
VNARLAVAFLFGLSSALRAQTDTVRAVVEGRIVDPNGSVLPEVEVIWQGDRRSVFSRADGSFSLAIPVRGEAVVLFRRPGYSAQVLRIDTSKGFWRGRVVLVPGSQRLPDIEVAARYAKPAEYSGTVKYDDFFRRQKLGLGTFISREQIEKMNAYHTLEILRGIPGVYVNPGNPGDPLSADIRMPRCTGEGNRLGKVTVWIDGQRVNEVGDVGNRNQYPHGLNSYLLAEQLERIAASGIEMIEVYRGASQIPGEFHWDGCAVIAIWTRHNPMRHPNDTLP